MGILRAYLPKKTDLKTLSLRDLKKFEFEVNNRPMKYLNWKTPYKTIVKISCTPFVYSGIFLWPSAQGHKLHTSIDWLQTQQDSLKFI